MRVGIDLDGVVHDFAGSYRRFIERTRYGTPGPITRWEFHEDWGIPAAEFTRHLQDFPDEIFDGDPLPGALEGLEALADGGHSIHIVTHRPSTAVDVTMTWLREHKVPHDTVTFAKDKTIAQVDLFLEDNVDNHEALREAGIHSYLLAQPWNDGYRHIHQRVASWKGFLAVVPYVVSVVGQSPTVTLPPTPKDPRPMRTPEQHEILGTFLTLLEGPTGDGGNKRGRGEKPSWKVDGSHAAAAFRHLDPSRERYDEDSGCHKYVHAAWRLLAVAWQEMRDDGRLAEDPA